MLLFWPITDDEDVEDVEDDWEFCCGTIHSLFGILLFMVGDLVGLPLLLVIYCAVMSHKEENFANAHYALPIIALSVATLTSVAGPIAVVRLYMCLYQHRCLPTHNRLVVMAMGAYLARLILIVLFALFYVYFTAEPLFSEDPDDSCDWENLWSFFHCIWVWAKRIVLSLFWSFLALQFALGACMCRTALSFVRDRYRGYWDNDSGRIDRDLLEAELLDNDGDARGGSNTQQRRQQRDDVQPPPPATSSAANNEGPY